MSDKNWKSAADLMAELNADPEYAARKKLDYDRRKELLERQARQAAPVLDALRNAGVELDSIWDLSDGARQPEAIPVLLDELQRDHPSYLREAILRGLATPLARKYWSEIVAIFENNSVNLSPELRYLSALAVSRAADESVLDDVVRLVKDRNLGVARAPLLLFLSRSQSSRAKMLMMELTDDKDIGKELVKLRRLKRQKNE